MGQRVVWLESDCFLEKLDRALPALCGVLVGVVAALQEQFVGLGVVGVALEHRGTFLAEQLQLQGRHDRQGDLVLQLEDIAHLAVVALRPHLIAIGCVDQLHGDPEAIAGAPDAAVEHAGDAEGLRDSADIDRLALERECRRACSHLQRVNLRQRVQQLFGKAVAEVLVIDVRAHVGERQDRERRHGPRRGR